MSANLLPDTSFVPVQTKKLKKPIVLWARAEASREGFNEDDIYCMPASNESTSVYSGDTRMELADRYGGTGCGKAAGSGRCSTVNNIQTKGVGITPLVAPDADIYHRSGHLSLLEACLETIYSECFDAALPYKAVPSLAVVLLDPNLRDPEETRALLMRPFVPRPAHFMRNVSSSESNQLEQTSEGRANKDVVRTVQAMRCLSENFVAASERRSASSTIVEHLEEFHIKLAKQSAASFARRLSHGSVNCSNLTLSARYIDFGVSNFVPNYRRRARPPRWQDTWNEPMFLLNTLRNFREQIERYGKFSLPSSEEYKEIFVQTRRHWTSIEFAQMAGFNSRQCEKVPNNLLHEFGDACERLWSANSNEPAVSYPGWPIAGTETPQPRRRGLYDLNQIFIVQADNVNSERCEDALRPLIRDDARRADFLLAHTRLFEWIAHHTQISRAELQLAIAAAAKRKNSDLDFIDRNRLKREIAVASKDGLVAVKNLLSDVIQRARQILATD